jgi:hypothetical protein
MLLGFTSNLRTVSLSLLLSTLAACGGGGGGGFLPPENNNSGGSDSGFSLTFASETPDGEQSSQVTSEQALEIKVTLTSSDGSPVNNQIIELSTEAATVAPVNGSALTDESGVASFLLTFNGTEGAGSVTASYTNSGMSIQASYNIESVLVGAEYSLTITSENAQGVQSNNVSAESPLTIRVQLNDGATPLQSRVVELKSDNGLFIVNPENGAALSDSDGQAMFQLLYAGQTGAGTITASYDGPNNSVLSQASIEAVVTPLKIGSLDDNGNFVDDIIRVEPSTAVGYLGSVELLFAVGNDVGERQLSTQAIRVESPCLLNGFASLSTNSVIELTDGLGSATYTAKDACSNTTDEVTATLVQAGNANPSTASTTLSISAAPAANERFITFIRAVPANIALKGTGGGIGLEERSQVTFEVRDGSGNPVAGQEVTFELSRTTGGLALADAVATTDANGQVAATVISGTVATPVRVIATTERSPTDLTDNPITVVSDSLSVSSGIATQARFSLGADILNPASAAEVGGIAVRLTATAYDRFGNAVPDGTAINFTSECGGIINPENGGPRGACETVNGNCQLEWRSQPGADTICTANRVTIMAHALGEEAFIDGNADGYFTVGETFTDNSEAFRNDNESSDIDGLTYDAGELFIDLDNDGSFGGATPIANAPTGLYNGIACVSDSTVCSEDLISVFSHIEIVAGPLDASSLIITVEDTVGTTLDPSTDPMDPGSFVVRVTDVFGNVPPFGTTVSATGVGECEVATPSASMLNSNAQRAFISGVSVIASGENDESTTDLITVSVSIPEDVGGSGNPSNLVFNCNP